MSHYAIACDIIMANVLITVDITFYDESLSSTLALRMEDGVALRLQEIWYAWNLENGPELKQKHITISYDNIKCNQTFL